MIAPPRFVLPNPRGHGRTLDGRDSVVVFLLLSAVILILALTKERFLPGYFFTDSKVIESFMLSGASLTPGDGFQSTAAVFRLMGAERDSVFLPFVTGIFVYFSMVGNIWVANTKTVEFRELVLFVTFCLMATIYMTTLSKDILVLGLLVIRQVSRRALGRAGMLLWLPLLALYAYYFRGYWFLVLIVYLSLTILLPKFRRLRSVGFVVMGALLLIAIVLYWKFGIAADAFRTSINEIRTDNGDVNARTMITPFISGGGFVSGYLNVCLTFIVFLIPIPLILKLSPYYWLIFLTIVALQLNFWRKLAMDLRSCNSRKKTLDTPALVIAFIVVQSIFEPDYGSYVRHLSPFYGIIFGYMLNRIPSS